LDNKRISIEYIENTNPDGDDTAGIIVSVFEKGILIGVTEKHGGDAEISLDISLAKKLINAINSAIDFSNNK
jgi:hypothetical protein